MSFDPPTRPPETHHPIEIEKINVSYDIPIDAKFDADIKNA